MTTAPNAAVAKFACWLALSLGVAVSHAANSSAGDTLLSAARRNHPLAGNPLVAKENIRVRDAAGNSALHFAALNHNVAAVRALLAAGADVDATNAAGATPLHYGAGNAEIVATLLAQGANPNAVSAGKNTPLMIAAMQPGAYDAVKRLLDAGADLHAKKTTDIEVVLERAANAGVRRTVELLLERGAHTDKPSVSAALTSAAVAGDRELVALLLSHGADPNYIGSMAGHALNTALLCEQLEVARQLIEAGARVDVRSRSGHNTPTIVWAAYNQTGDDSVARALVAKGADVQAVNDQGASALSYAQRSGAQTPLVKYLEDAGAKSANSPRTKRVPERAVPESPAARAALVRERLPATLALLQQSSTAFLENGFVRRANCTSCHGQDLPAVAYQLARARGFKIDDAELGRQIAAQLSRWNERAESARQMTSPLPGEPVTIAYGLFGLRASGYVADEMTDAMTRYILRRQKPNGAWGDYIRRPPMEDGELVSTAWVALSVREFPPTGLRREAEEALQRSARWLAQQRPANHNEAAFQLLGLHWSNAPRRELSSLAANLVRAQRADGGWAQLPALESDAWATGIALYALHEAAGMSPADPAYQRGVAFLLRTQFEDGSWWVRSRSWPFQPHFNGRFPHGKDQWISQGATAWAAIALLFTLEPQRPAPSAPTPAELVAAYKRLPAPAARATVATTATGEGALSTVQFTRDIQPIFERSCVGCHGGEKPRAGLTFASRDALLKGGASGEPAIVPGYADDSALLHYVGGKIEDLEMPPLDRREKYPPLTAEEMDLLRTWIDSGAPWSTAAAAQ